MVPDVVQFLTYMAGRTSKVELGTMVVVLALARSRACGRADRHARPAVHGRIIIGFGRGAATVEYNGFRVPMEESREALCRSRRGSGKSPANERFEHQGKFFRSPR